MNKFTKLLLSVALAACGIAALFQAWQAEGNQAEEFDTRTASVASRDLARWVQGHVTILDSLTVLRQGQYYRLYVVVNSEMSFEPIGIRWQTDAGLLSSTYTLTPQPEVSCVSNNLTAYGNDQADLGTVFETAELSNTASEQFAYQSTKVVSLFVRTDEGVFQVDNIPVRGKCVWLVD